MALCLAGIHKPQPDVTDHCSAPFLHHRLLDLHHWISGVPCSSLDTALLKTTPIIQEQPMLISKHCNMVRSTAADGLAGLANSSTIVLFTPVITLARSAQATNKTTRSMDPFETLGRAVSRHHKRVRHVPYVPNIGFTDTHDTFLGQADAVVVVICEPESGKHEALANQVDFAEATQDGLEDSSSGSSLILVQCGDPEGTFWPDLSQFDNTLKCQSYDPDTAQQIARKLFPSRK